MTKTLAPFLLDAVHGLGAALLAADCLLCDSTLARPLAGPICESCIEGLPRLREPFCPRCALPYEPGVAPGLCGPCRSPRRGFRRARAAFFYEDGIRVAVRALKFGGRERIAATLGRIAARRPPSELASYAAIIPIPLSRRRRRQRGFNQAEHIARAVAGRAVRTGVLYKRKDNAPQAGLSAGARKRNVVGTYRAKLPKSLLSQDVLLIDDVMTTGATVEAASRCLLRAGVAAVDVLVLARVRD